MPRTIREILGQADELAGRFEAHDAHAVEGKDGASLRTVRLAFLGRAAAEQRLADAVARSRDEGHSWASIGAMLGTSGEAARQRYRSCVAHD